MLFGANSETQWYCPPAVGALEPKSALVDLNLGLTYMDPISAIDNTTVEKPDAVAMYIYMRPALPPL